MYNKLYEYRNNNALLTADKTVSYGCLINEGEKFAKNLTGGLCLLITSNNIATVTAYLSLFEHNIPMMLLKDSDNIESLFLIIERYKPENIIIHQKFLNNNFLKRLVDNVTLWIDDYCIIKTNYEIDYFINSKLSVLLTTSGSTGSSKFVRLSKQNVLSNTESIVTYLGISDNDRVITTLPFAYSYGLSIINTHLFAGASIVLSDYSIIQKDFWNIMHKYKATTFGGVPYIYEMLHRLRFANLDLQSIKYITQAGGKLNHLLSEYYYNECVKKNILFYKMYGQTEATARISYLEPNDLYSKLDSIGKAIPGGELMISNDNNELMRPFETGEIIYKGKNVSLGYAETCYDLCKDDENNGILKTGDIGYYDNDGFFFITGRKNRFLKLFGNRINLDEVESILNNRGIDCACVGSDDKMIVYVEQNNKTSDINQILKENIDINYSGYKIEIIDKIPRNSAGKILYYKLG